jgi:predicted nuclease with TOPRIM domain
MGLQGLKQKAIQFMDAAKGAAPMNKVNADLEKLRDENAALKNMLKEQGDTIDQLTKQRR